MRDTIDTRPRHAAWLLALGLGLGACQADPGPATLRVSIYGEEFIEDRIPAEVFVDGWEVELQRFLVAVSNVEADLDDENEALASAFVIDLAQGSAGEGHLLGELMLPAEGRPVVSYRVAPLDLATPVSATADDVERLVGGAHSLWVAGQATKGDQTLRFTWQLDTNTHYVECAATAELEAGAPASSQITIHADHLFYDDLDSETPNVAFDLIASADANGDREITAEELRAVDITGESRYQVGSRPITDLWHFIEAQAHTLGHIDGEGHCELGSS